MSPSDSLAEGHRTADYYASLIRAADVLILVPPFTDVGTPSFAAHLLQACAREAGFSVSVFYAGHALAALIGSHNNQAICFGAGAGVMSGERFFSAVAYGSPPLGRHVERLRPFCGQNVLGHQAPELTELLRLESKAAGWVEAVAAAVVRKGFKVVGCTTMFQQTAASIALLSHIKRMQPGVVTIIGGANCEGEMAEGIASLCDKIDYIFSGESEAAFVDFLKQTLTNSPPSERIIRCPPCGDLDALPTPNYTEFFEQSKELCPGRVKERRLFLPFESSRGCWWGQKHHCTFCGLNGLGMSFREKSPERLIKQLKTLVEEHGVRKVSMSDNILPHTYFKTVLPRLKHEVPDVHLFYEVKANLTLKQMLALKEAGVEEIQPGVEALSSSLLRRMDKGVSAAQNIALLRYARCIQFTLFAWNMLYGFPGDELREYEETLRLLPLLRHLYPPNAIVGLSLDRFSPYFDYPSRYGISDLRPLDHYADIFPPSADLKKLAYRFTGKYRSDSLEHWDVVEELSATVKDWQAAWSPDGSEPPVLFVQRLSDKAFLLRDTRGLAGTQETQFLSREEAAVALVSRRGADSKAVRWALERGLAVALDGISVPLATAEPDLLMEFEREFSAPGARDESGRDPHEQLVLIGGLKPPRRRDREAGGRLAPTSAGPEL